MKTYCVTEEIARLEFAQIAAKHFENNLTDVTFTIAGPKAGALLALRWGLGCDCVVVVKLCEETEPCNYPQFINREKAQQSFNLLIRESKQHA
jgi:hypothetical protein